MKAQERIADEGKVIIMAEHLYAADQSEYDRLPAFKTNDQYGKVTTRWKLSWRERWAILVHGDLWLQLLTFNKPLQPVKLMVTQPPISEIHW